MRKSPEKLNDNERNPNTGDDGPWGKEYQESVPPFNPEQKQETEAVDDSDLVQKMVDQLDSDQGDLEDYLDKLEKQGGLDYKQQEDLNKNYGITQQYYGEPWSEPIEREIDRQQKMGRILDDALREQVAGSKELQGKPIEEILQAKIDTIVAKMKTLDESISSAKQAGDNVARLNEQYDKLIDEKNALANVLGWTEAFRKYSYNDEGSSTRQ